jgi:hypothetical protein
VAAITGVTDTEQVTAYVSKAVGPYAAWLEKRPEGHVLDVGPVCGENVMFAASRVRRMSVCDLFLRRQRAADEAAFAASLATALDYPARSFDSIHVWDLLDRLADESAAILTQRVRTLLKPEGAVIVVAWSERGDGGPCAFAVQSDGRVQMRRQPHLRLSFHHRHNRDILRLLEPLTVMHSYVYQSGMREFVFRA